MENYNPTLVLDGNLDASLSIVINCEEVHLDKNGIRVKLNFKPEDNNIDEIDYIEINGVKFKRRTNMTNEEWIKSLTGEDFVRELMHFSSCVHCPCYDEESCKNIGCTKGKLKWLQEEHNTEEN